MVKFPDIESLRHVIQSIAKYCTDFNVAKPTIKFRGTVKLHGTNAGVSIGKALVAQGRNRELTIGDDSFGFAHFVHNRASDIWSLIKCSTFGASIFDTVTVYGEWCGAGIQKGMAISSLPKHFVIFAAHNDDTDEWLDIHAIKPTPAELYVLNDNLVYLITQAPVYEVTVDFENPTPAAEEISNLTLQVEDQCPWGTFLGAEGIGEGIVWTSYDYPVTFQFKSKGLKHKKTGAKTRVELDPVKVGAIAELVDVLLPEWRQSQGIEVMRAENIPVDVQHTGDYIKWISQDILKEEADTIAANPFTWKELCGMVVRRSKEYYSDYLNKEAGLS